MQDEAESRNPTKGKRRRRRRQGRLGFWVTFFVALSILLSVLGLLSLTGKPLPAPAWLVTRIEAEANRAIAGQGQVTIGAAEILIDENLVPRVRLRDLRAFTAKGVEMVEMAELRVALRVQPMLQGRIEPRRIRVLGARVTLARDRTGSFGLGGPAPDLALGGVGQGSLAEILDAIDRVFERPVLEGIERIEAEDVEIALDDARTGRNWRVTGGRAVLTQDPDAVSLSLGLDIDGLGERPASVALSFTTVKNSKRADFGARVANVSAADLAAQTTALTWLAALDAPISGSFRTGIDEAGVVGRLDAALEIGAGALRPTVAADPVPFERAKLYLSYDPATDRLDFSDIALDSRALRVRANGTAWLKGRKAGLPETLVGQVRISGLEADPEGMFTSPVRFGLGALDLKVTLSPFAVRIGQLSLVEGDRRIGLQGNFSVGPGGWTTSLDVALNQISHDSLLALWPPRLVPGTRDWIAANVTTGELFGLTAAYRDAPGSEPRVALGYEFRGAEVRVLRTLPPVRDGVGYASIQDNAYTLVVDRGFLVAPLGGEVDVAGSVLKVPDIRIKPAPAEITLVTDSPITAALSLLDQPPFEFLKKAGRPVDVAAGRARAVARLKLVLAPKIASDAVAYEVEARLTGVRSDRLAPGRALEAGELTLRATREGMEIAGPGLLSGVPFNATWTQQFGPEAAGKSRVEGTVELSPRFLAAFGIGLPQGFLSGEGTGTIGIDLARDRPARFTLRSDLNRLRLSLPEIGWTKAAGTTGAFEVSGALGSPPVIEALRLKAPGLEISGTVGLTAAGGLDILRLSEADIGWFRGRVELKGRGPGRTPAVTVLSGSADMRRAQFGAGGGGGETPLRVSLDRLRITEATSLDGFRGELTVARGGLTGRFEGRLNGEAPVTGTVAPGGGGRSAFRIQSADAGAVFRAAGMFSRGRGGSMNLSLNPIGGPGRYEGQLTVSGIRVKDAPVLAELLGAVSVIGLLEQLGGDGILFNQVQGRLRLVPGAVELQDGRATGASLGVTMAGVYRTQSGALDMQGVITPLYFVNSLGQIVARSGEGLFGFSYRLTGSATAPKVNVNPLSILAPGFFRDIFRKAPPKVDE